MSIQLIIGANDFSADVLSVRKSPKNKRYFVYIRRNAELKPLLDIYLSISGGFACHAATGDICPTIFLKTNRHAIFCASGYLGRFGYSGYKLISKDRLYLFFKEL